MNKKNNKVTKYSFSIPDFKKNIEILICNTKDLKSWLKYNNYYIDLNKDADGACFGINNTIYLWFESYPDIGIIAHEAAHATFAIINKSYLENEELFCYLLEFIIYNTLECLRVI